MEKELNNFCKQIEINLREELKKQGYVKSFSLFNCMQVSLKKLPDKYVITVEANNYLKYLNKGNFLDDFLKKQKRKLSKLVKKTFTENIIAKIEKEK